MHLNWVKARCTECAYGVPACVCCYIFHWPNVSRGSCPCPSVRPPRLCWPKGAFLLSALMMTVANRQPTCRVKFFCHSLLSQEASKAMSTGTSRFTTCCKTQWVMLLAVQSCQSKPCPSRSILPNRAAPLRALANAAVGETNVATVVHYDSRGRWLVALLGLADVKPVLPWIIAFV